VCGKSICFYLSIFPDIDECTSDPNPCKENERCINKLGRYVCQCEKGFRMNFRGICEGTYNKTSHFSVMLPVTLDINECQERIICSDFCVNTVGSYRCECKKGYELARDGKTCRGQKYT